MYGMLLIALLFFGMGTPTNLLFAESESDLSLPPFPPPPPPTPSFGPGIGAKILEKGSKKPLPSETFPYTYVSLWRLEDNPYDHNPDAVQTFVNSTWVTDNQGLVMPDGTMNKFTTDWGGTPLSPSKDYTLVVQIPNGRVYKTAYRTNIRFDGVRDTDVGTVLIERSPLEIVGLNAFFIPARNTSMLVIEHWLRNTGKKMMMVSPYAVTYLPVDMSDAPISVEPVWGRVMSVCGGCTIFVRYELVTKKLVEGFEVGGQVVVTNDEDPTATLAVDYFGTHTK